MTSFSMRIPSVSRDQGAGWLISLLLISLSFLNFESQGASGVQLNGGSVSPHEHGLRPAESWLSALLPEASDAMLDPPIEEQNETELSELLGEHYDANFMSKSRPNSTARLSWEFPFRADWKRKGGLIPTGEMPLALQTLHLGYVRLPDGSRLKTGISEKLKRKLKRLLWAYTSCPVQWRWKDLGIRFWPRWLKHGKCSQGKGISCSVPPGMRCRPSDTSYKKFLRWHCVKEGECKWRTVEYPVITQCSCSCSHNVRSSKTADTTQV